MANNDEQRKTWIMLKKADPNKYIPFETNIIPTFTSNQKGVDEYGTWTCSTSGMNNGNYAYTSYDKKYNHVVYTPDATVTYRYGYLNLNLPSSIEIKLDEIVINWKEWAGVFVAYYEAYDEETATWVPITEEISCPSSQTNTTVQIISDKYWSKFRLKIYNTQRSSRASTTDIYEISFTKGTLKVKPEN